MKPLGVILRFLVSAQEKNPVEFEGVVFFAYPKFYNGLGIRADSKA